HLGTPRAVIEPQRDVAVWTWDIASEAFGNSAPNPDPDGDSTAFALDMRFPGQRYDAASGLNYNYFRDYEAGVGRYAQSDPIGMNGGIATYVYALQTPLSAVDATGLQAYLRDLLPPGQRPAGSIYCVDGVIRPFYNWSAWPSYYSECKEIRDCVEAHEISHANDAYRSSPGLCQKSPLHFLFGTSPRMVTFPNDFDGVHVFGELDRSELRAHAAELRCLAAKLKAMGGCDSDCRKAVVKRIKQIVNQNIPDIRSGSYRSN
ncbi:hypothetical protein FKV24_015250, partial [Lysobacter maris]